MKKLLKIFAYLVSFILIAVIIGVIYISMAYPKVSDPEDLKVELTTDRIERGAYLANHVTVCMDCHSERDFSKFSGPPAPGTIGKGGDRFDHSMGLPGVFYAKNITPFGISDYTDGELYRLITTGVTNEGRAMFPLMPYIYYGKMDPEDIYDIIAYVRSIPSVESEFPEAEIDFPVNLILKTMPHDPMMEKRPDTSDQVAYGAYLVNAASCAECHTPFEGGAIVAGKEFSGGRSFPFPDGSVVTSANITQDSETGIGNWTEEAFLARFTQYADSGYVAPNVNPGEFNSIMPWTMYGGMKESDLKAIYAYLKTVQPIPNQIVKFSSPGE
jgi:mono/diheme cytochrome c family protein